MKLIELLFLNQNNNYILHYVSSVNVLPSINQVLHAEA